ncbi:leucyl aminopeptidase [Mycetocola tolaasinivorans]|uniref:Probable cytosol aminopeptidase n=1 Tax=Mycetocola tolaasinivorans TaxID=76635 RepID=A0A3L7A9B5_9MICO|nr:leucyl aminopeptidase [Mycetocola tolaasinivorans]RLP76943.1 leucyl aminopeptidase [Mycetocola tolaasinivorans]
MTVPVLNISSTPAVSATGTVLVLGAIGSGTDVRLFAPEGFDAVAELIAPLGITGAADRLVRLPAVAGTADSIAIIGLGGEPTTDRLRSAAGSAVRQLAGTESVTIAFPVTTTTDLEAVTEGAALGAYSFIDYRGATQAEQKPNVKNVTVSSELGDSAERDAIIARAGAVAEAVALTKDLVNTPANDMYPESMVAAAVQAGENLPLEFTVWDDEALRTDGFGGLSGVGQGSTRGPRLLKISYSPEGAQKHLALVGKGITFDTGGLSLKPANSMLGMKFDMAGAAAVLGTLTAAAELGLPIRLTGWLCLAENMPSGSAIRPGDVITIRGGRTVEVTNTDAEGRLVLADGLVAAGEEQPDAIVDIATLTGAALVALGDRYMGVLGDDDLVQDVLSASTAVGEPAWAMPMPAELRGILNSQVADIMNANVSNRNGGMLVAAHFLKEFATPRADAPDTTIPWAHLDIAGPADNGGGAYGFTGAGATASGVRLLLSLAEEYSRR